MNRARTASKALQSFLLLLVSVAGQAQMTEPAGRWYFLQSDPIGATITVDGEAISQRTPALLELPLGATQIVVEHPGFIPGEIRLEVRPGAPETLSWNLTTRRVSVSVPGESELIVSGAVIPAENAAIQFDEGSYQIEREGALVTVEPTYPFERLRVMSAGAALATLVTGGLVTLDFVADGSRSFWAEPVLLTTYLSAALAASSYAYLSNDRAAYVTEVSPVIGRGSGSLGSDVSLFERATAELAAGNLERSLELYQLVVTSFPESGLVPSALFQVARVYTLLNRPVSALAVFKAIVSDYPTPSTYDRAAKSAADLLLREGRLAESLSYARRMIFADATFTRQEIDAYIESILTLPEEERPIPGTSGSEAVARAIEQGEPLDLAALGSEAVRRELAGDTAGAADARLALYLLDPPRPDVSPAPGPGVSAMDPSATPGGASGTILGPRAMAGIAIGTAGSALLYTLTYQFGETLGLSSTAVGWIGLPALALTIGGSATLMGLQFAATRVEYDRLPPAELSLQGRTELILRREEIREQLRRAEESRLARTLVVSGSFTVAGVSAIGLGLAIARGASVFEAYTSAGFTADAEELRPQVDRSARAVVGLSLATVAGAAAGTLTLLSTPSPRALTRELAEIEQLLLEDVDRVQDLRDE